MKIKELKISCKFHRKLCVHSCNHRSSLLDKSGNNTFENPQSMYCWINKNLEWFKWMYTCIRVKEEEEEEDEDEKGLIYIVDTHTNCRRIIALVSCLQLFNFWYYQSKWISNDSLGCIRKLKTRGRVNPCNFLVLEILIHAWESC